MFTTLTETKFEWLNDKKRSKCLVVFVHGMNGQNNSEKIKKLIANPEACFGQGEPLHANLDEIKHAALLKPTYKCNAISTLDPSQLAADLQWLIYEIVKKHKFEKVILAGHSLGAILIRKATAYGLGQLDDHPHPDLGKERQWAWAEDSNGQTTQLARLVLLAGINRGWSTSPKPNNRSIGAHCRMVVGATIGRIVPKFGRLLMSIERGSPFIANLRIQWIRLTRDPNIVAPQVTQLLGTLDGLVSDEDNRDITVAKDFKFVSVPSSSHSSILDFEDTTEMINGEPINRVRAQAILVALSGISRADRFDKTQTQIEKNAKTRSMHLDSGRKTKQIAFLMHGIRDNSDWPRRLREEIQLLEVASQAEGKTYCVVSSYGYFSMSRFLLWNCRQKNVRWFMDQYTEAIATSEMDRVKSRICCKLGL